MKVETQAIDDLAGSLRTLSAEVADKIKELQKLDGYEQIEDDFRIFFVNWVTFLSFYSTLREFQNSQAALAEKLVGQKISKPQFLDQEAVVVRKKDDCKDKILGITTYLQSV